MIVPVLLTLLAFYAITFVYVMAQAVVGRMFAAKVDKVCVGFDLLGAGVSIPGKRWTWTLGFVPLGGYTKFRGEPDPEDPPDKTPDEIAEDDPNNKRFAEISLLGRTTIMLSGPVAMLVLGSVLLAIPVVRGEAGLQMKDSAWTITAPATMQSQREVTVESINQVIRKYLLWQPLQGWGGIVHCYRRCGKLMTENGYAWLTAMGILSVGLFVWNLIPIGGMSGGQLLVTYLKAILRIPPKETPRGEVWFILVGTLYLLACLTRACLADAGFVAG